MRLCAFLVLCVFTAFTVSAQEVVSPEKAGLSAEKLAVIKTAIDADIADGKLAGATLSIMRHGKLGYHKAFGTRGNGASEGPMKTDDIFRIYSMSKPITTVAAMILMERGQLNLSDPLSKYIPAFAETTVLVDGKLAPQANPITIEDL